MSRVGQARFIELPTSVDPRGALTALEGSRDIPFAIERLFYMHHVTPAFERGGHAHPDTELVLIAVAGRLTIDVSDANAKSESFLLNDPARGLYLPPLVWTRLYDFSADAVCLAAASTHYEEGKVIRDWDAYVRQARQ